MKYARGNQYWAYGQAIDSELVVPEFVKRADDARADIVIRLEPEQEPPEQIGSQSWFFEVTRAHALMYFSGVAVFHLVHGKKIDIVPVPGADYRLIALYLSGTVFSVLLYQQGLLVLHASAVAMHQTGEAVLLMGESGAGKSSLAAALIRRGHQGLCDDVAALHVSDEDGRISVIPAFPYLKVDRKLLEILRFSIDECREVHENESKVFFPCHGTGGMRGRYPVRALVHLWKGDTLTFKPLSSRKAMLELVRYSVPTRLLHAIGDERHFRQCGLVASRVAGWSLQRNNKKNLLDNLAFQVEEKVASSCLIRA